MSRTDRSLLGVLGAVGALAASGSIHVADVLQRVLGTRGPASRSFLVVLAATGLVAAGRSPGLPAVLTRGVRSRRYELRFSGLLLAYAGIAVAVAGYLRPAWVVAVVAAVASAIAGAGTRVPAGLLAKRLGTTRAALLGTGSVVAGGVLAVFGPPFANAVAVFASTRVWSFARPSTPGGIRATTLVAVVAGVWSAGLCGRAGLRVLAEAARPAGNASRHDALRPGALLEVSGLDASYGQVQVLFGVDLHVDEGETVALLGTNGAGKSTILRAVFGLMPPDAGRVRFAGRDITGRPAERLVREGMVQIPGGRGVFPSLTVAENLRMAGYARSERVSEGVARTLDAFPPLRERIGEPAGVLSGGEQQMLALGRAWIARPKLLAIDELTLGLAPGVVDQLLDFVKSLRDEGISIIVVEQSVYVAYELAERAYFLERGEVRFEGRTSDLMRRDDLLRSIFFEGARS